MNIDLLRNPIIIGLIAGVITYLYMYWDIEQKHKKNVKAKKPKVNVLLPSVVAIIVWFIAASYLDNSTPKDLPGPVTQPHYKLVDSDGVATDGSRSYHLVRKNDIRLPPANVFIDLAKF